MREAQRQIEFLSLAGSTVTHADQFELLGESLGHPVNHVGDQGAIRSIQAVSQFVVMFGALHDDLVAFLLDGNFFDLLGQFPFGAFHRNAVGRNGDRYPCRDRYRMFTYS